MSQGERKDRVAFFGGSFDPPHLGHLEVARAAREALKLDRVLFAPVGAQPLKPVGATAPFEDRVAMTKLAIAGERGFEISLVDAPREGGAPNYTVETLEKLKADLGSECELFCLMGADSFACLRLWRRAAEIPFVATLIVASRPGEDLDDLIAHLPAGLGVLRGENDSGLQDHGVEVRRYLLKAESGLLAGQRAPLYLLPEVDVPISASQIRELEHAGGGGLSGRGSVGREMMPTAVADYIRAHKLYRWG